MYKETVVEKELLEIENPPVLDDEKETPLQQFKRLLLVALNAAADGRFVFSEQVTHTLCYSFIVIFFR